MVNGLSIARPELQSGTVRQGDRGSVILCRMDNGSVFRLMGLGLPGHSNWYRIHGMRGAMENTRGPGYFGPGQVRIWHDEWDLMPGEVAERTYVPDWPENANLARQAGHGGGDFWTSFEFAKAIRSGRQPFLNVYRGVAMSSVGILAWRSALEDGPPMEIPDFSKERQRKPYEDDHWSPFPNHAGSGQPPSSILGPRKPSKKDIASARQVWKEMGYRGK